jgi:hypothetical protein
VLHAARQLPAWLIFDVGQNSRARDAAAGFLEKGGIEVEALRWIATERACQRTF